MIMIARFIDQWNEKHPELPARMVGNYALIDQDRGAYGSIEVRPTLSKTFNVEVSKSDGEEMEPLWLGERDTVEQAIDCAEYGIHPGDICAICHAKKLDRFSGFVQLGKKIYCGEHAKGATK